MKKRRLKIFLYALGALIIVLILFLSILYVQVHRDASARIDRGVIDSIIFSESPVYYDDGETPIGVFFEKTHRKYIQYADIPKHFVKAIIASEDRNFLTHPGFDIKAIARAMMANVRARKTVQGGSTISQQTAKNIFKRQKRSYVAKLKELIQALILESRYSKEEILEMYVNQFFVTGFGRGLSIAAQYFFDKEAEDLDLSESAFIAGAVKGPYRYNPFTKKTETEKEEARSLAKLRKDYVLAGMRQLDFITEEEYVDARQKEIPFKEGKITYSLNVILDYIREQLQSAYFRAVLQQQGLDNIATSGIRIYTSINKEMQEGALRSIRRHLPLLDTKLSGYRVHPPKGEDPGSASENLRKAVSDIPFLCRITHINTDKPNPSMVVAWDSGGGVIDYEGLKAMAEAWLKWRLGNWASVDRVRIQQFLKNFQVGDLVAVQLVEIRENHDQKRLVLSKIPELDGGIIVLSKGMIKAMVGGFFDRFFNRAVDAKRQLGSIFKPLVYTAALQLKWNTLDPLVNMRDLFRFEKTSYIPKPDHEPNSDRVSMAWAGVKSENLATVWLLYHLTDHLNMSEFRQVVELLGLDRKKAESYGDYVLRIRDRHGVVVNREALLDAAFEEAKKEIESDLIFTGQENVLDSVRRLHFHIGTGEVKPEKPEEGLIQRLSFHRLRSLNFDMKRNFTKVNNILDIYRKNRDTNLIGDLAEALRHFQVEEHAGNVPRVIYREAKGGAHPVAANPLSPARILHNGEGLALEEIWIDGLIPSHVIDLLQGQLKEKYKRLLSHKRYDLEVLSRVRDFRTLVNLMYVTHISKKMGISTRLDPVLSFPLGANSISIVEAAMSYQTIMTGQVYTISDPVTPSMVPIITRIVDRQGETLWEHKPQPKWILTGRVSGLVSEILQKVMEKGTGKSAKDAIQLSVEIEQEKLQIPIPAFGKTGTADRFTNSSFIGFIPGLQKDSSRLDMQEGYVIATYVGYDDNRPMKGEQLAIYGASGALPLWIDTANAIANSNAFKKDLQVADLAFDFQSIPLMNEPELRPISVSSTSGLPLGPDDALVSETHVQLLSHIEVKEDTVSLKRVFEPLGGPHHEQ